MRLRFRFLEYLTVTSFVWGLYLTWLIPFQLWWVGMTWEQFEIWLVHGTILEMFFAYPLTKIIVFISPKITSYWESK